MKIRIQGFENDIEFEDGYVNVMQIKNKILFQNLMEIIYNNMEEDNSEIQLISDNEETLKFNKYVFLLTDLYNLNINNKSIVMKIIDLISNYIEMDKKLEFENGFNSIKNIVIDESRELPFEIGMKDEINIIDILKLFGVKIAINEYDGIFNRLELLVQLLSYLKLADILIIPNLKNVLDDKQLIEFYKISLYNKINLVLIESDSYKKLKYEKVLKIDEYFDDMVF